MTSIIQDLEKEVQVLADQASDSLLLRVYLEFQDRDQLTPCERHAIFTLSQRKRAEIEFSRAKRLCSEYKLPEDMFIDVFKAKIIKVRKEHRTKRCSCWKGIKL